MVFVRTAARSKGFFEALLGKPDNAIGRCKDGLGRSVIPIRRDDLHARRELIRETENVAYGCRAEGVDRLHVVADESQALALGLQGQQNRRLKAVRVLVLVYENVVEAPASVLRKGGIRHPPSVSQPFR